MKKGIFVLSALLTLVVSGICLQSCSSEYGEYTTEEYGSYTEEEVREMKAIAMQYGMSIEFEEDYYGKKSSLQEFEAKIQSIAALEGEYRMSNNKIACKDVYVTRSSSRKVESEEGSGKCSDEAGDFTIEVSLSWKTSIDHMPGTASGTFKVMSGDSEVAEGNLNCSIGGAGTITVTFSGSKSWVDSGVWYTCQITQGTFDITTNKGSFVVNVSESKS